MMKIDPITCMLAMNAGKNGLVSLMYHSVRPGSSTTHWPWSVSRRSLCEQLDLLCDLGWRTLCGRELENKKTLPPRSVCLTFDDGYADNFPVFEEIARRGMKASWFIVSRDIGATSSWPEKQIGPQAMLSVGQLREMDEAGMEICSHTVSHCRLTLADNLTVMTELSDSKKRLSDILGHDITTFAYPWGLYDDRIVEATRSVGYKVAFTTISGFGMIDNDLLQVRRITVANSDSLSWFARKLLVGLKDVSWRVIVRMAFGNVWERMQAFSRR